MTDISGNGRVAGQIEKPENGLAGLKHWKYDIRSGFMVALISLPFSMGIAITSGAPPVCGITSAIVAGFVLPFLGGSYVTVSGPAAGLAPVLYASMVALGKGDLGVGYPRLLAVIAVVGVVQFVLSQLKVARLSAIFPAAAIEGMLCSIGLMIIVKQFPLFFGVKFEAHDFWEILEEVPSRVSGIHPQVLGLGVACLTLLFVLSTVKSRLLKVMPPPVWAFFLGTLISVFFLRIDTDNLIHVPDAPLKNGITLPDFRSIIDDQTIWLAAALGVVTLVLIDGTESLATIAAVDKLDPYRRKSDPDRTLLAMGVSNVASSMVGGLTIIPGIVKSTANILGGGRTQWANFYNACFLMCFLFLGRDLINMVPKCVLASILAFVGYKLCRPKVWMHMAHIGKEQFAIFSLTVLVTVTTDLLLGIIVGVLLKLVLVAWYSITAPRVPGKEAGLFARLAELFRNPVCRREQANGRYDLYCNRPLVCFNLFHIIREMSHIPEDIRAVRLHLADGVTLVDHTTCENLYHYLETYNAENGHADGAPRMTIEGLERLRPTSRDKTCIRLAQGASAATVAAAT